MPSYESFDAWVTVTDVRLTEYDVQEETLGNGTARVTCWIPSKAGTEFVLHVKDSRDVNRPATASDMWADGIFLAGKLILSDSGPHSSNRKYVTLSTVLSPEGRKYLAFQDVKLTDDDDLLNTTGNAQLGELKIVTTHIKVIERSAPNASETLVSLSDGIMHERSKKAGVHSVQLGSSASVRPPALWRTENIGEPIVEFIFRYRPLDLLRANGIAPLPTPQSNQPSPEGSGTPLAHNDPNPGDVMQENDEIRELEERLAVLKRKRDIKEEPGIKTEQGISTNRRRTSNTAKHEVIDLTLDDD